MSFALPLPVPASESDIFAKRRKDRKRANTVNTGPVMSPLLSLYNNTKTTQQILMHSSGSSEKESQMPSLFPLERRLPKQTTDSCCIRDNGVIPALSPKKQQAKHVSQKIEKNPFPQMHTNRQSYELSSSWAF